MTSAKTTEYTYAPAHVQAAALAAKKISASELTDQSIARIEALDGTYNAVPVRDFARAREAAKAADQALSRGEKKPLLGVPMTVKESYDVAGLLTTWGSPLFKDNRARTDAVSVARLKAAGAIILGKSNVPVMLSDWQSYNDIYGHTKNPWNTAMSPGGSSGGSAASLAAGYVALEMGSDIGGSIRVPAHFCGVYGHKPSHDLVPVVGQGLIPTDRSPDIAVIGPLARGAQDLAIALDIVAGPHGDMATGYKLDLPAPRHANLKDYRVLILDRHPMVPTDSSVRGALDRLADKLAKAGATVKRGNDLIPDLTETGRAYIPLLMSEMTARMPPEALADLKRTVAALSPDDDSFPALWLRSTMLGHREWIAHDLKRTDLRAAWRALFRDWDVVLSPPFSTPAFPHNFIPDQNDRRAIIDNEEVLYTMQILWPGVAGVLMLPATVAPVERTAGGLPVGVQITGAFLEDRTTIDFARLMEREFGGFVPPPDLA